MDSMRRSAFDQGATEPHYDIRHQWAGNGRGKVTAEVRSADGKSHLPVAELAYRTAKDRAQVAVRKVDVHPDHRDRGLEQQMRDKLLAEYTRAEVLG